MDHSNRRPRVCLVTPSFPPELGGMAILVEGVARGLAAHGCEVVVATQVLEHTSPFVPDEIWGSVRVKRFAAKFGGRRFAFAPDLVSWLRRHQDEFDVIHAFSFHAPVALAASLRTRQPFFFTPTYHGGGHTPLASVVHVIYGRVARRLVARSAGIFCASSAERDAFVKAYPKSRNITSVILLAFGQCDQFTIEPFPVEERVILSAGRLDPYKRNDVLLDAAALLNEPFVVIICGSGPDKERLMRHAADLGLGDKVCFEGFVSDADLARWQRTAHVSASLSLHESFGLSLAESAAAGANILASDIPVHREILGELGVPAELVPTTSGPEVVARSLKALLAMPRRSPGENRQRSWDDVAADTLAAYQRGQ